MKLKWMVDHKGKSSGDCKPETRCWSQPWPESKCKWLHTELQRFYYSRTKCPADITTLNFSLTPDASVPVPQPSLLLSPWASPVFQQAHTCTQNSCLIVLLWPSRLRWGEGRSMNCKSNTKGCQRRHTSCLTCLEIIYCICRQWFALRFRHHPQV